MRRFISPFLICAALWLLWSGMFKPLMLIFGFASCLLVAAMVARMQMADKNESVLSIVLRLPAYLPWLIVEIVKSNIDVARRVWDPKLPISPTVVTVEASQNTALGLMIHANSITLTPGTLSIDTEPGYIEVHSLATELLDAFNDGEMDKRVTRLEGPRQ